MDFFVAVMMFSHGVCDEEASYLIYLSRVESESQLQDYSLGLFADFDDIDVVLIPLSTLIFLVEVALREILNLPNPKTAARLHAGAAPAGTKAGAPNPNTSKQPQTTPNTQTAN